MKFDYHYLWSAKYAKWIIIALISLFSILIVLEVFSLFSIGDSQPSASDSNPSLSSSSGDDSYQHILKASLFGLYLDEAHVKKSMLNVTLVGILFAEPVEESQVIIRLASGDEKVYKVGDDLPGEVTLKRILADGILVERLGVLESISLPKESLNFEPAPKPLKEE